MVIGGALLCAAVLASCAVTPDAEQARPTAATTASATPTPAHGGEPVLVPDGSAEQNLPLFTAVTAQVWASDGRVEGRAYIDALVAAGFPKERMQVTADRTTVGHPVESLQFSVAWGTGQCLVGQVGPSTGDPVTVVVPQLAQGRCLVGSTRPIDW